MPMIVPGHSRERKLCLKRQTVQAERHKGRQTLTERNRLRGILGVPLASIRERMYLSEKTSDAELSDCIADQRVLLLTPSPLPSCSPHAILQSASIILIARKYFNYLRSLESFKVIGRYEVHGGTVWHYEPPICKEWYKIPLIRCKSKVAARQRGSSFTSFGVITI